MAMKIKKGDNVIVIAGKDKDKQGKILAVDAKNGRVVVEGVNKVTKHQKQNQGGSGIITMEAPIDASNVMFCENGKGVRVGFKVNADGKKVRVSKKTGKEI